MKAYGGCESIGPLILNLGTGWECSASLPGCFKLGETATTTQNRQLGGFQGWCGHYWKNEKLLASARVGSSPSLYLLCNQGSLVTVTVATETLIIVWKKGCTRKWLAEQNAVRRQVILYLPKWRWQFFFKLLSKNSESLYTAWSSTHSV